MSRLIRHRKLYKPVKCARLVCPEATVDVIVSLCFYLSIILFVIVCNFMSDAIFFNIHCNVQ